MTIYERDLPDTILGGHIANFLTIKNGSWRPSTRRQYTLVLGALADYVGEKWPLSHVDIMGYLNSTNGNNITKRSYFGHIRALFSFLETLAVIVDNPARTIGKLRLLPPAEDLPPVALTKNQITQFFGLLTQNAAFGGIVGWRDLALFRFAYVTGARAGEIARLTWPDVNLADRAALIRVSKSHKYRIVYFSEKCAAELTAYRDRLTRWGCAADHVFLSLNDPNKRDPAPFTPNGIYQLWQRRLLAAGLKPVKLHALRHTAAQHAIDAGIPIYMVQSQLGHANIETTAKYLRGRDAARSAAYKDFDAAGGER